MPKVPVLQLKNSTKGELYAISLTFIDAWFPILALYCVTALGAIHTYFYSLVIAATLLGLLLWQQGKVTELKLRKAWWNLFMVSLTITSLYILVFLALRTTSPNHVALILFLQVLFAYLFFGRQPEEQLSSMHKWGVMLMSLGAVIILFPEDLQINKGDLWVLMAALIAPFANLYQKRARQQVSSLTILFVRSAIALPFLYLLATLLEPTPSWHAIQQQGIWLLLIGGLAFVVGKVWWIEAIRLLPITKVNALYAFAPALTLLLSYWLLGTPPTHSQILGAVPIILGSLLLTRQASAKIRLSANQTEEKP
ncbi:DMT family transporter [Galenea microaerophila]